LAVERALVRLVVTAGIIGIGAGLGALLASNKVQGWTIGLVVAVVSIVLSALLRRS
jgi:ribose 5-phosphate isomerase RpiB